MNFTLGDLLAWMQLNITESLKKRVFNFIFKRVFSRFIKELNLDQFDIELSSGKISLNYPQLNLPSINSVLGDFPFILTAGVIENITVVVPWTDLLNGKMKVDIASLDLTFCFKENCKNSTEILSSVKESFLGERKNDVLATSVFMGELRKSDVHEEFKQEKTNFDINDDEEIIARIIEGIIGSLKATISKVTLRFEFPNLSTDSMVVAMFHIPEIIYEDKTQMPEKDESWYPSFFKYRLKFSQFYVQLFEEDEKNIKKSLQHKNTMIFGDSTENIVNIKLVPGEYNKQSSLDVECILPSIHSIIKTSQIEIITKLSNLLEKFISKGDEYSDDDYDDDDQFHDLLSDDNIEKESQLDPETIQQLLNNEFEKASESQFYLNSQYDTTFKNFENSNVKSEEFFSDSDSDIDSIPEKSTTTKSLNNSPINFTLRVILLKESSVNLLYKDIDLKNIWSTFKSRPKINEDHLVLNIGESNFLFSSLNGKNLINLKVNDFNIKENLFNKENSFNIVNSILQFENNPNFEFQYETKKKINTISITVSPLEINFDVGFKERIMSILKKVNLNFNQSKSISSRKSSKTLKDSRILHDLDRNLDNIPKGLEIDIFLNSIKFNILYPEDGFKNKLKFKSDKLIIHLDEIKLTTKMNSEKKNTKWKGEIDSATFHLNDAKILSAFSENDKKIEIEFTTNDLIKTEVLFNELDQNLSHDLSQSSIIFKDEDSFFGKKHYSDSDDSDEDHENYKNNIPQYEEKDWFEMGETLDKTFELQRKVDASEYVLNIAISKILVNLTEQQLKKLHVLMIDLLMNLSISTEVKSTSDNDSNENSFMFQPTTSNEKKPKTGIKLQISEIEVFLKDVMNEKFKYHSFQFVFTDFVLLNMIYSNPSTLELYIRNQRIEINKLLKDNVRIPLVRKYERMIKNFRKNKESILVNLTYKELKNLTTIVAQIQMNGLYINHGGDPNDDNWIVLLSNLFSSEPTEEQFITNLYVLLQDTMIDYQPFDLKSRLLIIMNEMKFSTNLIVIGAKSNDFLIEICDISFLLKNDHTNDIIMDLKDKKQTMLFEKDLIDFLGFIQIANLNSLEVKVVALTEKEKSNVNNAPLTVEIKKSTLKLQTCSDSLQTTIELLKYLMKGNPKSEEKLVENKITNKSPNIEQDTFEINLKEDLIDINKFDNKKFEKSKSDIKVTSKIKTSDSQIKLFNNFSGINIMDNYFTNTKIEEKPKLKENYSLPEFELLISDDINIEFCLFGGEDWKKQRDYSKVLKLSLFEFMLQYHLFKPDQEHNWRFKLQSKDIEIKDEILTSERNLFLSYFKDEKNPREDGSNMIEILIEGVNQPREELKVDIIVLPLRLNVHQETLSFLQSFFVQKNQMGIEENTEENEVNKKFKKLNTSPNIKEITISTPDLQSNGENENVYFQSVLISPLVFKIDYQPVSVNFTDLKKGNWSELSNIIPLSGIEINFDKIKLLGISGNDKLIEEILKKNYLPKLQERGQLFKFALGIMPVKSVYNVSSGILDLVLMPVVKYNRDGQFLRGIKNGFSSFARNLSIETMGLTANTLTGANTTLKIINETLSDERNLKNKTKSVPNNLSDGMTEAYKSISSGVSNSVNALISISNETDSVAKRTVRAVPIAILSPIIGTSEALTNILQGARVWIDPTIKEENDQIYKN
eukprot:gene5870-9698_t